MKDKPSFEEEIVLEKNPCLNEARTQDHSTNSAVKVTENWSLVSSSYIP